MPLDIVLDKVLDQLCSPSNSSDIKASASNYQLPDNALDICFDSNTALSNENNHTSKLSQGLFYFRSCVCLCISVSFYCHIYTFFIYFHGGSL